MNRRYLIAGWYLYECAISEVIGLCQFSVLPGPVPVEWLLPNPYADIDGEGRFESATIDQFMDHSLHFNATSVCSCTEVLAIKGSKYYERGTYG